MTSGPRLHYHNLSTCFYVDKNNSTAQSHCHQHNITVAEVSPEADSVYTSTTTDLLYLEKKRTSASPSSRLNLKKKNKQKQTQRRDVTARYDVQHFLLSWRRCLGGIYTLRRTTQARLRNLRYARHPVWRRRKQWRLKGRRSFWWALPSCWFPFETSCCTLRQRSSFHRDDRFLNPLNAYRGNVAARLKWPLMQRRRAYKQNEAVKEGGEEKKKGAHVNNRRALKRNVPTALLSIELFNVLRRRRCQTCFRAQRKSVPMWQLCHCVLLLLFQMSDKCQPLHRLAFC